MKTVFYAENITVRNQNDETVVVVYTNGDYIIGYDMLKAEDAVADGKYETLTGRVRNGCGLFVFTCNTSVVRSLLNIRELLKSAMTRGSRREIDAFFAKSLSLKDGQIFVINEKMQHLIRDVCDDEMYQIYKNKPMMREETFAEKLAALEDKWSY